MRNADGKALTASILCAAVLAETCAKRILRQAEQLPVREATEYTVARVDVLVHSSHIFIHVSAGAGRLDEIVRQSIRVCGQRNVLQQECRRGIDARPRDDVPSERGALVICRE